MEVNRALGALHFSTREASRALEKLLKSAIANWETKTGKKAEDETLYVTKIMVDGGMTIKRMLPAPQGRAYRIRKRWCSDDAGCRMRLSAVSAGYARDQRYESEQREARGASSG